MSQSTKTLPSISTWGESTHSHPAQLATLNIIVSSEGPSQSVVSEDVANASAALRSMLETMSAPLAVEESIQKVTFHEEPQAVPTPSSKPVSKWSSSNLSTGSYLHFPERSNEAEAAVPDSTVKAEERGSQGQKRFTATQTFDATFTDFPSLGPFATILSTMANVSIAYVSWSLTAATHASEATKSRKDAVRDAVTRAGDLADGLMAHEVRTSSEKREVRCVEIKEERDRYSGGYARGAGMMSRRRRGSSDGGRREELVFQPEELEVRCEIEARFELVSA